MLKDAMKEGPGTHVTENLEMKIHYNHQGSLYHWHDEYEFVYVMKGAYRLTIDGEMVLVRENQAVLISGGQLHEVCFVEKGSYIAITLHPHICGAECAYLFSGAYRFQQIYSRANPDEAAIIENLAKIDVVYRERGVAFELRLRALIADTFAMMFERGLLEKEMKRSSPSYRAFEKLVRFIHTNHQQKITLELLSDYSNYSKSYILFLFKKYTGKTPMAYINSYRISKAQTLLTTSSKSVLDIAFECGYENIGYFIRTFQKYVGQTPGKWRKS